LDSINRTTDVYVSYTEDIREKCILVKFFSTANTLSYVSFFGPPGLRRTVFIILLLTI